MTSDELTKLNQKVAKLKQEFEANYQVVEKKKAELDQQFRADCEQRLRQEIAKFGLGLADVEGQSAGFGPEIGVCNTACLVKFT
jgi:hypothetical protein